MTKRKVPILSACLFGVSFLVVGFTIANSSWMYFSNRAIVWFVFWTFWFLALIYLRHRTLKSPATLELPWPTAMIAELLVVVVSAVLIGRIIYALGYWQYTRALAVMQASGQMLPIPANEVIDNSNNNGAFLWEQAAASKDITELMTGDDWGKDLQVAYSEALRSAREEGGDLAKALGPLRPKRARIKVALLKVDAIRQAPIFHWNIDHGQLELFPNSHSNWKFSTFVQALVLEALFLIHEGKLDQAEYRLEQCLWLSDKMLQIPTVLSAMMVRNSSGPIFDVLLSLVKRGRASKLIERAGDLPLLASVKRSLAFDAQRFPGLILGESAAKSGMGAIYVNGFRNGDAKNFLWRSFGWVVGLSIKPWMPWVACASSKKGSAILRCLQQPPLDAARCIEDDQAIAGANRWRFLDESAIPDFGQHEPYSARMLLYGANFSARQRVVFMAAKALVFKRQKGRWPKFVDDLGLGERSLDPYTLMPLQMKIRAGKLEVSTFGRDGKEDKEKNKDNLDNDYVVRL